MTTREQAIEAAATEPKRETLYLFDWKTEPSRKWKTLPDESGTELGWFDGRNWVAAFGRGMWSAVFVTAFRPAFVTDRAVPVLLNDLADRIEKARDEYRPQWDLDASTPMAHKQGMTQAIALVRAAAEGWGR